MDLFENNVTKTFPKIICVAKNYLQHLKEKGVSGLPQNPVLFLKPWSSISYQPKFLSLPSSSFHLVEHEIQLGVFISKGGKKIAKEDAMNHAGGYFIGIDFSDRDFQQQEIANKNSQTLAKCQDNFCPISSIFNAEINPNQIELELKVNGQIRQKDMASKMHFKIDEIISYTSQYMTLNQGDIFLTGTPSGVGAVKKGDFVEAFARKDEKILASLSFQITE